MARTVNVNVQVKGLAELRRALANLDDAIQRGGERAIDGEVQALATDMRDHAPVGDASRGRRGVPPLAQSIVTSTDGLTGQAGPRAPHAPFVEHGTSSRPADPFVLPAAERARGRFPRRVADDIKAAVE